MTTQIHKLVSGDFLSITLSMNMLFQIRYSGANALLNFINRTKGDYLGEKKCVLNV